MKSIQTQNGFAIPVVLVVSAALIMLTLAVMQSVLSMRTSSNYAFYSKLAEEAAESGSIYAYACLRSKTNVVRWEGKTLSETTDCEGNALATSITRNITSFKSLLDSPSNVNDRTPLQIRFAIRDSDVKITPNSYDISSSGQANRLTANGSVMRSFPARLNMSVHWESDTLSQRSVSGTLRTCGILSSNVYCWGNNAHGQLGNNSTANSIVPVKVFKEAGVLAGKAVTDIFAAQDHNCVLADGEVYCWGRNNQGQLGDGTTTNRLKPIKVGGALAGKTVTAVGGTSWISCAIAEGKIYCWGYNVYGSVGTNSSTTYYTTPTLVATAANGVTNGLPANYTATVLTSGSRSANMCAIADGKAYCWGPNKAGQIGNNTAPSNTIYRAPVAVYTGGVLNGKIVTAITQDGYSDVDGSDPPPHAHVCVVATNTNGSGGWVYCWGENESGQLGNNSTTDTRVPVAASNGAMGGKTVVDVAAGLAHNCALT
ncbi:MAG TPA: hypothetical protein PKD68_04715, partial [Candidatus Saccharibacteria bacterium]|nr:hypothetical protein [Candidatus Saccharibacteria bacterium]